MSSILWKVLCFQKVCTIYFKLYLKSLDLPSISLRSNQFIWVLLFAQDDILLNSDKHLQYSSLAVVIPAIVSQTYIFLNIFLEKGNELNTIIVSKTYTFLKFSLKKAINSTPNCSGAGCGDHYEVKSLSKCPEKLPSIKVS